MPLTAAQQAALNALVIPSTYASDSGLANSPRATIALGTIVRALQDAAVVDEADETVIETAVTALETAVDLLELGITAAPAAISAEAINWALGPVHTKTLAANTTFTFSNATDGQTINVLILNTGANYTVTWPTVIWSGGVAPTQTVGAVYDLYSFIKIGANIYGGVSPDHHA